MELDEPIDYSTPAWRLAKSVNDYFAGWEPLTMHISDTEYEEFRLEALRTCEVASQTPQEWLCPEATQRVTEMRIIDKSHHAALDAYQGGVRMPAMDAKKIVTRTWMNCVLGCS